MSLITATGLAKSYGAKDIFSNLSLSVPPNGRIAIVGPNGVGKTTLLRLLIGIEEPSAGKVHRARNLTLGYLPQESDWTAEKTLWEECLSVFDTLRKQEEELSQLEAAMNDPAQAQDALLRYGRLQQEFEQKGGYTYENRIRQVLNGLGFNSNDYHSPIRQLSGGQRTRALLARLLLSNPRLLVLDEPTNHLDVSAVEWLEDYLVNWEGSILLVSHDRYLLDRIVNQIWELSPLGLEIYHGNYSAYLQQRQERWELRMRLFEEEKARLEEELEYIRRNLAGQNAAQAKGRLKRLSRQLDVIERVGLWSAKNKQWAQISQEASTISHSMNLEEVTHRVRTLRFTANRPPLLKVTLKASQRSGNIVLRAFNLLIGYPEKPLFTIPEIELRRLECAALIGPNGAGKTTFLKTILGHLSPLAGEMQLGASLQIGYFAQGHEDLNEANTLMKEIESVAPHFLPAEIRDYLARFLFTGDDAFRYVSTLSGGERGRLALAKLALLKANLLLLDEPTNHLDIPSQEALQEVLSQFQGTILLVSHDRYLIEALATQIWEIDTEEQILKTYKGNYQEYLIKKESKIGRSRLHHQVRIPSSSQRHPPRIVVNKHEHRLRLREVEEQITALEKQLFVISKQLETPPPNYQEVQKLGEEYRQVQSKIDALLEEWEALNT